MATSKQTWAIYLRTGVDVRACNLSQIQIDEIFQGKLNPASLPGAIVKRQVAQKQDFAAIHAEADKAGMEAVAKLQVVPMVVNQHSNVLDDNSPVVKSYFIADGCCGFASVEFPANTSWAKWAIKNKIANKSHSRGAYIWISQFNQSLQRKETYAYAYCSVLNKYGIKAYASSRMD